MTKDDIIRMAHEAGLHLATEVKWMPIIGFEYAERLIQLAQAAEREACAKVCDEIDDEHGAVAAGCAAAIRARK